jgi:hypothetical protein
MPQNYLRCCPKFNILRTRTDILASLMGSNHEKDAKGLDMFTLTPFSARWVLPLGLLALALGGCVLQSPAEIFPETKGVAALESMGTRFSSESLEKDGTWKAEKDEITFVRDGNHYVARNSKENDEIAVLFAKLDDSRFVMQAKEEAGKPFAYMIAEIAGGHVMLTPLWCDQLKSDAEVSAMAKFEGSDCTATGAWDERSFMRAAKLLGPAKMRLTPIK